MELGKLPQSITRIIVGKESVPTIRMQVVAVLDSHIWHCFFSLPGLLHDLNILNVLTRFSDIMTDKFLNYEPKIILAQNTICWSFYSADGIYPAFTIFVRTIVDGTTRKEKTLSKCRREFGSAWKGSLQFCFKGFISLRTHEGRGNRTTGISLCGLV